MHIFSGFLKKKQNRRAVIIMAVLILFLYFPVKKPLVREYYSRVITDKEGSIMRVFLTEDQQYCLPPGFNDTLPWKLEKAVVQFEDRYFYLHPGVNPVAVIRALAQNLKQGRVVSGASTISMQLSRIRKGRERRTVNKLLEMVEALRIEAQYTKKEVLKLYLDHAPYGGNIVGYQAASWRYFGKPPQKLSWAEACLLAVLPNSPGTISPVKNNDKLREKRNRLLKALFEEGTIDELTMTNSIEEPMPDRIVPFDLRAPHLTRKLHGETVKNKFIIKTSINAEVQDKANYLAKRYAQRLKNYGIKNISVLVVENKTRKIRAYIGSQDFYGEAGRVDGVKAPRSSGSLLKPFLYALSMQEGLIIPQSQLQDIPTYYGAFSPHNASEMYDGIVTAHDALVRSLNVPAVRLLYTFGHYKFYNFMEQAGVSTLYRSADDYGLPMIIGGTEVNLWDMAAMYCSLANLGGFAGISCTEETGEAKHRSLQLIDTASVVLTLNILKDLQRPGAENYWNKFNSQHPVAWKTGTSFGHKDAWAVGVNPGWTVAVWVGNFDATTNKNLSGAKSAGPLLFDIINTLPNDSGIVWWNPENYHFETTEVCAITGYAASSRCEHTLERAVAGHKSLKQCPFHRKVFVDSLGQYSVCSRCWSAGYSEKSYIQYPPLVTNYLRKNGAVIEKIPIHNPACEVHKNKNLIEIEYPRSNSKIIVARDFDGQYQPVVFSAVHQLKDQVLYWYVDNRYLGQTEAKHKLSVTLAPGKHILSLLDTYGNKKEITFYSMHN